MDYADLRDLLSLLERKKELIHIEESVDWNIEIGAISQESINLGGESFICENIKDHTDTSQHGELKSCPV